MAERKLTTEQIERACILREESDLTTPQIISRLGLDVSGSALSWHFLVQGADRPGATLQRNFYAGAGNVSRRGNHIVRRFTKEEDAYIVAQEQRGANLSAIGRGLTPPRQRNSIQGRLATLARYDARCDLAREKEMADARHIPDRRRDPAGDRLPDRAPAGVLPAQAVREISR